MITLLRHETDDGEITILRSRDAGSCIYCQRGSYQSEADGRGVSLASYIHAIYGLVKQSNARDVLMIGCGGGTLATMLAKGGDTRVTVIDVNPASIILAKRFFSLPNDVVFYLADGRTFLQQMRTPFDAIIVDAFIGNDIPQHLRSPSFFQLARSRLADIGSVFLNAHVAHDFDFGADAIAAAMADGGLSPRVLDTPHTVNRNAIVMGGAVSELRRPTLNMAPSVMAEELALELGQMRFRPYRPIPKYPSMRAMRFDEP